MATRIEYRAKWTYPFLEYQGKFEYGPSKPTKEQARGSINDDGWTWAGKLLGYEVRTVTESEWQEVNEEEK